MTNAMSAVAAHRRVGLRPDRTLIWADEFDGATYDTDNWVALNRSISVARLSSRPENVFTENSSLVIRAIRDNYMGKPWSSAWLRTDGKFHYRYGLLEARIKAPIGAGMWPAFWIHGDTWHIRYPEYISGEIDIWEHWDSDPTNLITLYAAPVGATAGVAVEGGSYPVDITQWHIYGMEWTPDTITFFLDGEQVGNTVNVADYTNANGWNPYRTPQTIQLDNMPGQAGWRPPINAATPSPADMRVDWVRVYAPVGVDEYVNQTGLTLDQSTMTVAQGSWGYINATITPGDAADQTIKWSSSNPAIATAAETHLADTFGSEYVAMGGVRVYVDGIAPGTATITATTNEAFTASCVVTVTA